MDERTFTSEKTGKLIWVSEGMYHRFEPKKVPFNYIPSSKTISQSIKTASALGELKGLSWKFSKQEIRLLQYPFMIKEAQLSSEIEGTRSTIADVYRGRKIKEIDVEKRLDNEEINNYQRALEYALKEENQNITEDIIKKLHGILLKGVRGHDKNPGKYKTEQNAVGSRDDTFDSAKFVPASSETTPLLMSNFVNFVGSLDVEPLHKIAISHYQFEAIHPFRDGNGRLGRLLIMLQICNEKFLPCPLLYVSEYFNRNRDTYIESLFNVSSKGNLDEWVLFFLKALEYQANQSIKLLDKLQNYKAELQGIAHEISKSPNMHLLVDSLFKQPFISVKDIMELLSLSQPGSSGLVKKLVDLGIVREVPILKSRKKIYVAKKILDLIEGRV